MKNNIFSLDIGTRSVTGIILEKVENKYQVIDFCTREHKERSMLDGQIQNVLAVSEVIKDVTNTLKERNTVNYMKYALLQLEEPLKQSRARLPCR